MLSAFIILIICLLLLFFFIYLRPRVRSKNYRKPDLSGQVALVTGASKGLGKGIAIALGECGACVYITARTVKGRNSQDTKCLEDTAKQIEKAGGKAIIAQCDHYDDKQVEQVFERIQKEQGRLDILVNNVWAFPTHPTLENPNPDVSFYGPNGLKDFDGCINIGVRSHLVCSRLAVPLMKKGKHGIIINTSSVGAKMSFLSTAYTVGKSALDRMVKEMAKEVKEFNITVVSLWPSLLKTEEISTMGKIFLDRFNLDINDFETPLFVGRVVANLVADKKIMSRTGKVIMTSTVCRKYGVLNTNGKWPFIPFLEPSTWGLMRLMFRSNPYKNFWGS